MSSSLAFVLAVGLDDVLPALISVYAAYWAFSIRRAMASPLYHHRALWMGVLCLANSLLSVNLAVSSDSSLTSSTAVMLGLNMLDWVVILFVFTFIDTTIPVMRRSDPLLRRILHWDRVRLILWTCIGLAGIYLLISSVYPSSTASGLAGAIGFPIILGPFVVGAAALLVGVRRSRDPVLRGSLKWIVGFLALVLLNGLLSFIELVVFGVSSYDSSFSYPALAFVPAAVLEAYCLYRSARSLAPMNTLSSVAP
jgi:hypothetical protein